MITCVRCLARTCIEVARLRGAKVEKAGVLPANGT